MSTIITIKDHKIHPNITISSCNICLQYKNKIQKCSQCQFFICDNCLIKWYKYNITCPHCKYEYTFQKPITNRERCNICFNKWKKKIKKNHDIFLVKIEMITKYFMNIICNKNIKDCLSNTVFICGVSLFYLIYGVFYISFYMIIIGVIFGIFLGLVYCFFCCCCCRYNKNNY